jgi:hypothetical protein
MTSAFFWRMALVAFLFGVLAGLLTVAVHGRPAVSIAFAAYNVA